MKIHSMCTNCTLTRRTFTTPSGRMEVSDTDIHKILTLALTYGSYWLEIPAANLYKNLELYPAIEFIYDSVLSGSNILLESIDGTHTQFPLNMNRLLIALDEMGICPSYIDSEAADCILQTAVFDNVLFEKEEFEECQFCYC